MDNQCYTLQVLAPEDIQQSYPDTCAIKVQQIILEQNGISLTEEQLMQEAMENGWYYPGSGTYVNDVGNLLELHGLEVKRSVNASIDDIADNLANGNSVIVGVDSGELWHSGLEEELEDNICGQIADHALIVNGISVNSMTGEHEIMLTDPGTGDISRIYEINTFLDAWNDSDNFILSIV